MSDLATDAMLQTDPLLSGAWFQITCLCCRLQVGDTHLDFGLLPAPSFTPHKLIENSVTVRVCSLPDQVLQRTIFHRFLPHSFAPLRCLRRRYIGDGHCR